MLVLSRSIGEKIVIDLGGGETATLVVVDIDRGKMRLGIIAPRKVPIFRQELLTGGKKPKPKPVAYRPGDGNK